MENLSTKVELYLDRSFVSMKEVELRKNADGKGPFIFKWNIKDKPKPTLEELNGFEEEANKIAKDRVVQNARDTAMQKLLPEKMCMLAMLRQAKADMGGGKKLCPEMKEAVDIYSKIQTDHPKPS